MKYCKNLNLLSMVVFACALLSGCANIKKYFYHNPSSQTLRSCDISSVLITNLKPSAKHRQYMLPNGQFCQENFYNEQ